ncbi:MAG: HlyD family efflux transporter periplasmic adaptor subunit [Clostridia bacterium]
MRRNRTSERKELQKVQNNLIKRKIYKNKLYIIILCLIIFSIAIFFIWYKQKKDVKAAEATSGKCEIYTETKGYILNKETVVKYNADETLIPIAESEKRITINNVIGIYKNNKYNDDVNNLKKIDEQVNEKLKILPEVYSNDVISIDREIDDVIKSIRGLSSYIEMADYKTKLDNLAYKKALTISSLTPSGEEVTNLILEREKYTIDMNNSSNNVKAPLSGIMIYKNDGLEDKFELKKINKITKSECNDIISQYDKSHDESFGLKIVDNYESYILIKVDNKNDKYIIENKIYMIELLDKNKKIRGELIKNIKEDDINYCIFKITNNIEDIVDLRKTDIKVVWKELNGLIVNSNSLKKVSNIDYITIISLNKYIDIPVKILLKLENLTLVSNYTKEEKEKLNIKETRKLALYDRVVENNK